MERDNIILALSALFNAINRADISALRHRKTRPMAFPRYSLKYTRAAINVIWRGGCTPPRALRHFPPRYTYVIVNRPSDAGIFGFVYFIPRLYLAMITLTIQRNITVTYYNSGGAKPANKKRRIALRVRYP